MSGAVCTRCGATPAGPRAADGAVLCERCAMETAATIEAPAVPAGPLRPGARLGPYEILAELGRGGMAVVYRAHQSGLEREVALKVLRADFVAPDQVERFRREAQAAARLSHPNIVPVHDVGQLGEVHFLAMELVRGEPLDRRIKRAPLDVRTAATLVRDVARALHYAHEQGVVHRDVKPANILLGGDDTPRIADFGLARMLGTAGITAEGTAIGTPAYMAPEQAAGESNRIGPGTDVYACGAMLYECLTGSPPFGGSSVLEILRHVQTRPPESISVVQPQVPRDVATIAHKALEKGIADRYPSAAALADDLEAFLAHRPIAARPIGWAGRVQRAVRRRPLLTITIGACVLAAVVSTAVAWSLATRGAGGSSAAARHAALPHYEAGTQALKHVEQARLAGDAAAVDRELASARTALDRALVADPAFELAYLARARTRVLAGDQAGALADYDLALEYHPELADALYERARLRFHRHFGQSVGVGIQDGAEQAAIRADLQRLVVLGTRGEREHAVAAMLHLLAGELEGAVNEATQSVELNEYFTDGFALRAAARTARGYIARGLRDEAGSRALLEQALDDYDRAAAIGAPALDVLPGRAQALAGLARVEDALAVVARWAALAPDAPDVRLLRARLSMMHGDRDQALADLAAAAAQLGETASLRMHRATVRLVPAIALVTQLHAPDHPPVFDPADVAAAMQDLNVVVAGAPGHTIARFYRAIAHTAQGHIPQSARDLDLFARESSEHSAFGQAARAWLAQLQGMGVAGAPAEPAALWSAHAAVRTAETLLLQQREDAAAEQVHGALDELSGIDPAVLERDAWLRELEQHVRQRGYLALARLHARALLAATVDAERDAAARRAIEQLGLAYLSGHRDAVQLEQDVDLRGLADRPDFQRILDRIRGDS